MNWTNRWTNEDKHFWSSCWSQKGSAKALWLLTLDLSLTKSVPFDFCMLCLNCVRYNQSNTYRSSDVLTWGTWPLRDKNAFITFRNKDFISDLLDNATSMLWGNYILSESQCTECNDKMFWNLVCVTAKLVPTISKQADTVAVGCSLASGTSAMCAAEMYK